MQRILCLLLGSLSVTAPAWASHRYQYLLSSGPAVSGSVVPMTFSFYWESDTLLFPSGPPGTPGPACTGAINAETLPNYTATISSPVFTVSSITVCHDFSNYPVDIDILWQYQGSEAVFQFVSKGTVGEETDDDVALFTRSPTFPTPPVLNLDVYAAPTLWITDTWSAPPPPRSICTLCILSVFITAGPVVPAPGSPVEATVGLVDLSGAPVGAPQSVKIIPGEVTSVDFEPGTLVSAAAVLRTNQDVIPVVTLVNAPPTTPPLQVTTESSILNGLGRQLISAGVSPPPSTLAPQSISTGQTMRIIAFAGSPNACVTTLGFATATGTAVGPSASITLNPGQAQTLVLHASTLSLHLGQKAVIQPIAQIITAPPAAAANGAGPITSVCSVTSEVIDTLTGFTLTYQNAFLE
jgi:hypothetical protein